MKVCPHCSASYGDELQFCPADGGPLDAAGADPFIGRVLLGQFELRAPLGKGAMGTVYRAWQTGMEREVAVKVLHPALLTDEDVLRRFRREARAVARLSHPNIVTVFVVGEMDDGVPYIAMELVDGEPLSVAIEDRALPEERAVRIIRQVVSALAEAHAQGIIHRDLKPANILLAHKRRAADFVKILDFGIAKIVGRDSLRLTDTDLTKDGAIWGTPYYLSPEQATGSKVDARSDLYSVGVILFRLLTGRMPFEGSGVQVLLAHAQRPTPDPRALAPNLDPRLGEIILRCMQKDPADRYASAEQLADALDALAVHHTLTPWASGVRRSTAPPAIDPTAETLAHARRTGNDLTVHAERPERVRPRRMSQAPSVSASAPLALDGSDELAVVGPGRRGGGLRTAAAAVAALIALGAAAGLGVYWLRDGGGARSPATGSPRPAPAPQPAPAPLPEPSPEPAAGTAQVLLSDVDFALRVTMPERIVAGVDYEISLEAWDGDGEPIRAPEIVVTVEEPGGLERGLAAKPTDQPGRFRFRRAFRTPGVYSVHVFPPAGNTSLKIALDVVGR